MRRLFGAICWIGLLVIAVPPAHAAAPGGRHLTKIQSPRADQVVPIHGHVRAVVRSRVPRSALRITVNGRNMTRFFHRSAGAYRATLRGKGLHPGVNELAVQTKDYKDFDRLDFIVAHPAPALLKVTDIDVDEPGAPVRAEVRVRPGISTLRAWMNGHRIDHAFQPRGRGYVGRLGANDWVREGRNKLEVLVYREGHRGRSAVHDVASTTFRIGGVIAGAGHDRVVDAGDFIELRASAAGTEGDDVEHRWEIVDAPDAGDAVLEHEDTPRPEFQATTPGTYRVRATVRAAGDGTAANAAANDTASTDTVTVVVRRDVPPIGWRLLVGFFSGGTIMLDGVAIPKTTSCVNPTDSSCGLPFISYAVFNRQTLALETSGSFNFNVEDPARLADIAAGYRRDPTYLMVINSSITKADDPAWGRMLDMLGVAAGSAARLARNFGPVTIVGVPGSPPGSAFVSAPSCPSCSGLTSSAAAMAGYLRMNPNSTEGGDFEFVRTDQVEFNTAVSAPAGQVKMRVGPQTVTGNVPTDGSAGFFMVTMNSQRIGGVLSQDVFVTNRPDKSEIASEHTRMADALTAAVEGDNIRGRALVLLQSFGNPSGSGEGWLRSGVAIGKLGGNAQVFTWLNRGTPDEPHQGRYALVGRAAMAGATAAESSQSLTGKPLDGTLHGLLARARDDQYLPLLADPTGGINFDLVNIVNRPTAPNGGFPVWTEAEAAAADFYGRNVMKLCLSNAPSCDVRKAYYERISGATDWSGILASLGEDGQAACATAVRDGGAPFADKDCEKVRGQLRTEVRARNQVAAFFGPTGLQEPFGTASVKALINIAAISDEIEKAVQPPAMDNSASNALNVISFVVKIAGAAGGLVNPAIGTAANGVAATFGLAAYLTKHNGAPDLVGPEVRATATRLGGELAERYQNASSYLTTEAQIVMSDWTKMAYVAEHSAGDDTWRVDDNRPIQQQVELAAKQTIYQSMLQVAYPVIYDLGTGISDARNWICRSDNLLLYDKNLFQKTIPAAQMRWVIPPSRPGGLWEIHLMAVGGKHTVGRLHGAYVPAPLEDLAGRLFRDPKDLTAGGIGLYKLSLFAPPAFRVFPQILQQTSPSGNAYGYWTCQDMPNPPGNAA